MGNVIAESAGGGATGATGTTREYIYLYETEIAPTMGSRTVVDRPLAVVSAVNTASPATYWVSVDHLNRPIKMTNAAKASVWDAVWQPWGGIHGITGSASLDARFPGQWYQAETGLHYNWHRSYDPTLGRYTQPDPLGFVDGPSVYGYAGGSPLRSVDLDGRLIPQLPQSKPPSDVQQCAMAFCRKNPWLPGCQGPEMGGSSGGGGGRSRYEDVTRRDSRFENRQTDIDRSTFEKNLIDGGFKKESVTNDVTRFTREGSGSYTVRSDGNNGPTVDFRSSGGAAGAPDLKIRLKP